MPPFPVLMGTTLWWQLLGRGAACPLQADTEGPHCRLTLLQLPCPPESEPELIA